MTAQEIATELLREWQECPAEEMRYLKEMTAAHLGMNTDSDRAHGVYEDNAPEGREDSHVLHD